MFRKITIERILFLVIIFLICNNIEGQKLIKSRQTSYYTYIYKLAKDEAKKIYKKDIYVIDKTFFHTLIDSFPTDSQYSRKLSPGYYLKTYSEKNRQKFLITTVPDFDVKLFNNNTDLCIQVFDLNGKTISDAEVRIRMKNLKYDTKTQSYIDKKSNQKGLLIVSYNGNTIFYNLTRQYNNSAIKRVANRAIYSPVKYIWVPIEFIVKIPFDGVKSIVRGWPQGSINSISHFFQNSINRIFDPYTDNKFQQRHTGYIVFNKPKYLPADTVRFKAYLITKKGKAIDKVVNVKLYTGNKLINLANITPYTKGAYEYAFPLHDSLKLQLDKDYYINLEKNNKKKYISGSFKYEDYELSKINLDIRLDTTNQYKGSSFSVFVKGTDENDLNLLNANLEILATFIKVNEYFNKSGFVSDTLHFIKTKLEPDRETQITIPDSLFPKSNISYDLQVKLITSQNEILTKHKSVDYYYLRKEFEMSIVADSLMFIYKENGIPLKKVVNIYANDNFGNITPLINSSTPIKLIINPYFKTYSIKSDSLEQSFDLSNQPALLQCYTKRTRDSLSIFVDNPRKIPFVYNIYKKNTEQSRGFGETLDVQKGTLSKQNYYVSLRYLWGGNVKEDNYQIPFRKKILNLEINQPSLVFPGQKSRIEILVKDQSGKPVQGVDLTAYALTSKFNSSAPELPYLGKYPKNKNLINNFYLRDFNFDSNNGLMLDYTQWKLLAGIDSIEYYKFIYPGNNLYIFEYLPVDSLTQFAPFVINKGSIKPINVIYVDNRPVYFSWSTNIQSYSFRIDSGYHNIKLRLTDKSIFVDSVYFHYGKKLIFSLNEDLFKKNINIQKADPKLSAFEKQILYKYIFPYRNNFGDNFAYIEQGNNVQYLKKNANDRRGINFAGPVSGNITFNLLDDFTTNFLHEPFFEYDFAPGLLKMRSIDSKIYYPKYMLNKYFENDLADHVITKQSIQQLKDKFLENKRLQNAHYTNPVSTSPGAGKLQIYYSTQNKTVDESPLNILIFKYDNPEFLRIYPGNANLIHDLSGGLYKLIFFYSGSKYSIADSINIHPNSFNYYQIGQPVYFQKDSFSRKIIQIIEQTLFQSFTTNYITNDSHRQIYNAQLTRFPYTGEGPNIEGFVLDDPTGEPIPGVTIMVKGTAYGTLTDLNGHYSIKVPTDRKVLIFSFIGYNQEEVNIGSNNQLNVRLQTSLLALEEVVVIGYGTQKKMSVTGAVSVSSQQSSYGIPGISTDLANSLQGKLAGISVNNISDAFDKLNIRGIGTLGNAKPPLYIIDGQVYTGDISKLNTYQFKSINVLKDEEAKSIYGAMGANGVIVITTKNGIFQQTVTINSKGAVYDESFLEAASQASAIRKNFSDYAFWQPKLTTDQYGKVSFDVSFPGDITSWQSIYLAMNNRKQSGQTQSTIKSYKPLMAQLAVPRFLVQADTSAVLGKVLNYLPGAVDLTTQFEINSKDQLIKNQICENSIIDTLNVIANEDSILVKYYLKKSDGYFDGEQKIIPVYPLGLEESKGNFFIIGKDSSFTLQSDQALGKVYLYAFAGFIDVLDNEIAHLMHYLYNCNEQIASKLKALLAEKQIMIYKVAEFKYDREIEKLINLLLKNQNDKGFWGWWKDSKDNYWISLHILESLIKAREMGFKVDLDESKLTEKMVWELESNMDFSERVRMLKVLKLLNSQVDFYGYIKELEKTKKLSLNNFLNFIELKQMCKVVCNIDTIKSFQKETLFGSIYFSDNKTGINLCDNEIQNTILAYRIFRNDTLNKPEYLDKIRNYFVEIRRTGYWTNTYESSRIIETILPDLLRDKPKFQELKLAISGDVNKSIEKFPFEIELNQNQKVTITKKGDSPLFFTSYQHHWNYNPQVKNNDFIITTHFDNDGSPYLQAGNNTKLIVNLEVIKDADYIMINIPIPGGCSYSEKDNNFKYEVHREYFKNQTTIFCEQLKSGKYHFEVDLIPRYSGNYTVNPAKVELMYFPTFNANTVIKRILIK